MTLFVTNCNFEMWKIEDMSSNGFRASFYCENTIIQYTEMLRRQNIHFRPMFINCKIGLS